MVTGSYASSIHGIPRATRDIDIVIVPTREQLARFVQQLPSSHYYASLDEAMEVLRFRTQFTRRRDSSTCRTSSVGCEGSSSTRSIEPLASGPSDFRRIAHCAGTYVGSCVTMSITDPYAAIRPCPSTTRIARRAL